MKTPPFALILLSLEDKDFKTAERVEAEIFKRAFNNSSSCMAEEYNPYRKFSKFLAVRIQYSNQIIGVMRLIHPSPLGLKSLIDLEKAPWHCCIQKTLAIMNLNPATTIDIATLGIIPGYRFQDSNQIKNGVMNALIYGMLQYCSRYGFIHGVTILQENVLDYFQRMAPVFKSYEKLGFKDYLGARSIPQWIKFSEVTELLKQSNELLFEKFINGKELRNIMSISFELLSR